MTEPVNSLARAWPARWLAHACHLGAAANAPLEPRNAALTLRPSRFRSSSLFGLATCCSLLWAGARPLTLVDQSPICVNKLCTLSRLQVSGSDRGPAVWRSPDPLMCSSVFGNGAAAVGNRSVEMGREPRVLAGSRQHEAAQRGSVTQGRNFYERAEQTQKWHS